MIRSDAGELEKIIFICLIVENYIIYYILLNCLLLLLKKIVTTFVCSGARKSYLFSIIENSNLD